MFWLGTLAWPARARVIGAITTRLASASPSAMVIGERSVGVLIIQCLAVLWGLFMRKS